MHSKGSDIKVPKQFKHWLKRSGLKFHSSKDNRSKYFFSLLGHGYYWRVDCSGNLCRSCKIEDFDRWANSEDIELPLNVSNKHNFITLVATMILMEK